MSKQEIQDIINKIRSSVGDGKTLDAVEELADFTKSLRIDKFRDEAITIQAAKKVLRKEEVQNLASSIEIAARKNKLNQQLLLLLTRMENELVEGMTPEESRVNTDIPPIAPPIMNPPSTSSINWKIIIPVALLVMAGLVYFFFFRNSSEDHVIDVCEAEFEDATTLFDLKKYGEARQKFTDIKFNCPVEDEIELERYIRLCNEGMETDGISEGVIIDEITMTATPQSWKGKCPINIQLEALVLTNQPEGELICQLKLSNGKSVENIKAIIQPSGAADIKLTIPFEEKDIPDGNLTATLEVIEPVTFTSEPLNLELKCTENAPDKPEQAIIDGRDGRKYRIKKIGNTTWLLDNMNLEVDASNCLDCNEHGRHYKKSIAPKVCPSGYALPTIKQFEDAKQKLGSFDKMVETLELDPAGKYFGSNSSYNSTKNISAYFWVADVQKQRTGDLRKHYYLDFQNKTTKAETGNQYHQYSCRCVRRFFIPNLKFQYVKPTFVDPKLVNPNLRVIKPGN